MDKEREEIIVKAFFNKYVQDRFLFELCNAKKRKNALNKLCHGFKDILNERYMIEIPKPNSNFKEIADLLSKNGAGDLCYSISFNKEIDGNYLSLSNALEKAVGFGMPSLISCIPNELAYFESEQEIGPPQRFILRRNM